MDVQSATLSGNACLQRGDTQLPKGRVSLFDESFSPSKTDRSILLQLLFVRRDYTITFDTHFLPLQVLIFVDTVNASLITELSSLCASHSCVQSVVLKTAGQEVIH